MNTVLVTGGCGFIGSHISIELIRSGFNVCIVDSLINSSENIIPKINKIIELENKNKQVKLFFRKGDLRNKQFLESVFKEFKEKRLEISSVIHCAGLKSVGESVSNPLLYWDCNLNSTLSLLGVMDKYDCRNIVFSSSATVYGLSDNNKLTEDSRIEPINPYGSTKHTIENLLRDCYESENNKWKIINLRYFNPIGAHTSGMIGENPKGIPNNIFPLINEVALCEISHLNIFGNDWDTLDGTGVRDYIHVMDLAEGHVKALEYLFKNNSIIMNLNLGTGKGTSVLELINVFKRVNNVDVPTVFAERRKGDFASVIADNTKAKKVLNWLPNRNIEQMCRDGWLWYSKNKEKIN